MKTPRLNSTSSGLISQMSAARSAICRMTPSLAVKAARPVSKVMRLPPELPVKPTESVSTTVGTTSSTGRPSISATCIAIATRVPDRSADPVTRLTVPLEFTLTVADEPLPPPLKR